MPMSPASDRNLTETRTQLGTITQERDTARQKLAQAQRERDVALRDAAALRQQLQAVSNSRSPVDPLTEATKNLSPGDKVRLADALFEFSQSLDQAESLFEQSNILSDIQNAMKDGSIGKNIDIYRERLQSIIILSKTFQAELSQVRAKWKYYSAQ